MRNLRRLALVVALATAGVMASFLGACGHTLVTGPHTVPGIGPGGRPMTTVTDQAVGMPAVPRTLVYPVTARIQASDTYFGTRVAEALLMSGLAPRFGKFGVTDGLRKQIGSQSWLLDSLGAVEDHAQALL